MNFSYFAYTAIVSALIAFASFVIVSQITPCSAQLQAAHPRQIGHEVTDCRFVPDECIGCEDSPSVFVTVDERVQFWSERLDDLYAFIGSAVLLVSGICEPVIDENGNQKYDDAGKRELTCDNNWLSQVVLLVIVIPIIGLMISLRS